MLSCSRRDMGAAARERQAFGGHPVRHGAVRAGRGDHLRRVAGVLWCRGRESAIQNYALASPYALTMWQAAAMYVGVFYLVMLGILALTLALSALTPSTLAIIVTDVVVLFVSGLLPLPAAAPAPRIHAVPHGPAVRVRPVRVAVLIPARTGRARPHRHGGPGVLRAGCGGRARCVASMVSSPGGVRAPADELRKPLELTLDFEIPQKDADALGDLL